MGSPLFPFRDQSSWTVQMEIISYCERFFFSTPFDKPDFFLKKKKDHLSSYSLSLALFFGFDRVHVLLWS